MRKEGDVWEIVNKERRERKRINEGIEMGEWDKGGESNGNRWKFGRGLEVWGREVSGMGIL